jgi:diacylglycerol kinase
MVRPAIKFDETDVSANIGILSDMERATLTAQTTQKYAAELENLLIPLAWRKKTEGAKNLVESFYHAFHGMWIGLQQERNLRIHFVLMPVVVALGVWLKVDTTGWITLVISMGLVVTAEFMNTALEHLVDISTEGKYHQSARYAKDTAASAVLCAALTACVAGCIVLGPRLAALGLR